MQFKIKILEEGREFVKFPKTDWFPVGKKPDKEERYLTDGEIERLLYSEVDASEKLDGANAGISFQKGTLLLQKRGSVVRTKEHLQYGAFKSWTYKRYETLSELPEGTHLFGEFLYSKHSVYYTSLPSYFILFDVWKDGKFLPLEERDKTAKEYGLCVPPTVYRGKLSLDEILPLIKKSNYSDERMEGIVVRSLDSELRGKCVRDDFVPGNSEHWTKGKNIKNLLASGAEF